MSVRFKIAHPDMIGGPGGQGVLYVAEIEDSQYSGDPLFKHVTQTFFEWSYDILDERDPFANPVQKSSFTINLRVESDAELTLLNDILDADEDRFKIHFYIDGVHKWSGKVLTDLIEYPEGPFPFTAKITAKDLSNLEGVDYDFVDVPTRTRLSVIIAECLQETGLNLPIRSYTNLTNAELADQSEDFLYAIFHQKQALRNKETPLNCLEVLETICLAYNLLIQQAGGRWIIEQLPAVAKGDDVQFDYDSNGENPVSSTPDRTITIDQNSSFLLPTSQNKVTGALHSVTSTYKHRTLIHSVDAPDVTHTSPGQSTLYSIDFEDELDQYFKVSLAAEAIPTGLQNPIAYFRVSAHTGTTARFLNNSGSWQAGQTSIEVVLDGQTGKGSIDLDPVAIPTGVISVRVELLFADSLVWDENQQTYVRSSSEIAAVTWSDISAFVFATRSQDWGAAIGYRYVRSGNYSVTEEIPETLLGDGPTSGVNQGSRGRPYSGPGVGDYIDPGNFRIRGESGTLTLEELRLRERISMRRNALRNIRASLWMKYSPENLIEYDGKKWFFLGGRFQAKQSRWDANILLLDYKREAGDVFQTFVEEGGDPSGASSGSGSGGSTGSGITLAQADSRYLQIANDLSEVDASAARSNLSVYSKGEADSRFLQGSDIGTTIQAHSAHLDTYAANPLTGGELEQLQNIGSTAISAAQWGTLGGLTATAAELNRLDGDLATVRGNLGLGTTDDVQFRDLTARNLELTGVINYVNENNLYVEDKTITLNRGGTDASSENGGLIIERPGGDQSMLWNSTDGFAFSDRIKASGANFGGIVTVNQGIEFGRTAPSHGGVQRISVIQETRPGFRFDTFSTSAAFGVTDDAQAWALNKMSVGGTDMSGSETLRVSGSSLLEGAVTVAGALSGTSANFSDTVKFGNLMYARPSENRFEVWDALGEKAVMGYLNDIPKNSGDGDWGANDYGFWVKEGDKMIIDGDLEYDSGDWLIENDATLQIVDGITENRILAFGTHIGRKGVFGYDGDGDADSNLIFELSKNLLEIGGEQGIRHVSGERTRIGTDVDIFGNLAVSSLPRVSDEGLVGLWRFDEGSGSVAVDSINGNNGTITGATYITGVSGSGLNFSNDSDQVVVSNSSDFDFDDTDSFTVVAWVQTTDKSAVLQNIVDKKNQALTSVNAAGYALFWENDGDLRFVISDGSGSSIDSVASSTDVADGNFHFCVGVVDRSNGDLLLYVDGQLEAISSITNGSLANSFDLVINGTTWPAAGIYDEIRIYSRALSPSEIKSLYLYPSGNSGGLISANTVQTGQLISTNYDPGSGSFSNAGTLIDLDTGLLRTKNMLIDTDGKITFGADVSLSWENITDKPDIPEPVELPSYINETFIGATEIKTPTFTGNTATFNTRLNIGAQNFISGLDNSFQWGGASGITYAGTGNINIGTGAVLKGSIDIGGVHTFDAASKAFSLAGAQGINYSGSGQIELGTSTLFRGDVNIGGVHTFNASTNAFSLSNGIMSYSGSGAIRMADWNISSNIISRHRGNQQVETRVGLGLSTVNAPSSDSFRPFNAEGSGRLGFSINLDRDGSFIGHLVMGQIYDHARANVIKDGFWGLQMMYGTDKIPFRLAANPETNELDLRISSLQFDENELRNDAGDFSISKDGIKFKVPNVFPHESTNILWEAEASGLTSRIGVDHPSLPRLNYQSRQHMFLDDENRQYLYMQYSSSNRKEMTLVNLDRLFITPDNLPKSRSGAALHGSVYLNRVSPAVGQDYYEIRIRADV